MNLSNILDGCPEYEGAAALLRKASSPIAFDGIADSAAPQLICQLISEQNTGGLVILYSDMEARGLYDDLKFFTDKAVYFPSKEIILYNIETTSYDNVYRRLAALERIYSGDAPIIISSLDAVSQYTIPPSLFKAMRIEIRTGDVFELDELAKRLVSMGYVREDMVEGIGQFSIRGGILDVFPPSMQEPVRIEFFDDEVDLVRVFDPYSQRTLENIEKCVIIPASEALVIPQKREKIIKILKKRAAECGDEEAAKDIAADIDNLENNISFPSIDKYAELLYDGIPTAADHLPSDFIGIIMDPKRVFDRAKNMEWEFGELMNDAAEKQMPVNPFGARCVFSDILATLENHRLVTIDPLSAAETPIKLVYKASIPSRTMVSFHGKIDFLYDDIRKWSAAGATVVVLASNRGRGENLAGVLNDRGISCGYSEDKREFSEGGIAIMRGNIRKGFEYPSRNFVLVSDREIFESQRRREKRRVENAERIKSYNDISVGDYVVHREHGIGIYAGIQNVTVRGVSRDYLEIKYDKGDTLHVPIDQLDLIYKYTKNTDAPIKLNRIGGAEWNRTKRRVKSSTDKMAAELIRLYAERQNAAGYAFSHDSEFQREFEDSFGYTETEDQLRSIEEVKGDMEKPIPMDRLLCGDVGYGKTEVALRAAFKAAFDGKQTAYLCPTTVLAMQQYNTFLSRMSSFGIKVEMLSRFRTAAQSKKIINQLKTGEIDIIIGTHKLLSKEVRFHDLGLLIVDEEQRFGVAHKEKLKELKKNVDVLTMTATPIPRTLHMSMINIRDMSVLSKPPENRYPVQTYVLEENPSIILNAVKNELSRGGQVFYLHNRIDGIYRIAEQLQRELPDKRVAVGHGQMRESELEDIMYDMVSGETDVLVCTTIIETGLDIPNANTIIIDNADKMGLAQLYQLRGRVGRSNRTAYAYFVYNRDKILSETAQKRLQAIKEFTQFGSGFKIAMRDLEIRGSGNILGSSQHGHMDAVGYDMYCRILKESIRNAQGEAEEREIVTTVDFAVDAYLPEKYIPNHNQRIDMYKRIAAAESEEESRDIADEMIDRWGNIPVPAANIIRIALVKNRARGLGITEISQKDELLTFKFDEELFNPVYITELSRKYPDRLKLLRGEIPSVRFNIGDSKKPVEAAEIIINIMYKSKNSQSEERKQ